MKSLVGAEILQGVFSIRVRGVSGRHFPREQHMASSLGDGLALNYCNTFFKSMTGRDFQLRWPGFSSIIIQ